jgi:hypothetical protein
MAMGLKSGSARVVTAFGGSLSVSWTVSTSTGGEVIAVLVEAPVGTSGVFVLAGTKKVLKGSDLYGFHC